MECVILAASELKHGSFSLLSSDTLAVTICTPGDSYPFMLSNITEVRARGAPLIGVYPGLYPSSCSFPPPLYF
jgi:glucosamine 6-phosphate synthetase-like amidotransferase/phosphosugar isomerase protein